MNWKCPPESFPLDVPDKDLECPLDYLVDYRNLLVAPFRPISFFPSKCGFNCCSHDSGSVDYPSCLPVPCLCRAELYLTLSLSFLLFVPSLSSLEISFPFQHCNSVWLDSARLVSIRLARFPPGLLRDCLKNAFPGCFEELRNA